MYDQEQAKLSALGRSGGDGFARIATFVLCTIRMPLHAAVADYKLVRRGRDARSIFGSKHAGLAYIAAHAEDIHDELEYLYETCASDDAMLRTVLQIPGIGLAKGGFILQMIYGVSGCIDTHNLTRFGIDPEAFQYRGAMKRGLALCPAYNATVQRCGGTRALWDGWCDYLAARDPINYASGDAVSKLHLVPLTC
jgi:hypothetical protein